MKINRTKYASASFWMLLAFDGVLNFLRGVFIFGGIKNLLNVSKENLRGTILNFNLSSKERNLFFKTLKDTR